MPKVLIHDPELTFNLPTEISACSGMDTMANTVEVLYAQYKNSIVRLMAVEAITQLAQALPEIVQAPQNMEALEHALYGAWLAGVWVRLDMVIHHKICHSLGGHYHLPLA